MLRKILFSVFGDFVNNTLSQKIPCSILKNAQEFIQAVRNQIAIFTISNFIS